MIPKKVFCDGGLIGRNPSTIGGTWAWAWASKNGEVAKWNSGVLRPSDAKVDAITNNLTELYAAVMALDALPVDWKGTLYTDSMVTVQRLCKGLYGSRGRGVPPWLRERANVIHRFKLFQVKLVGGHPTREELASGRLKRNGLRTHRLNVFCDNMCTQAARNYLQDSVEEISSPNATLIPFMTPRGQK